MVMCMFSDELARRDSDDGESTCLLLSVGEERPGDDPSRTALAGRPLARVEISLDRRSYPEHSRPLVRMVHGPNVSMCVAFDRAVAARVDALPLGRDECNVLPSVLAAREVFEHVLADEEGRIAAIAHHREQELAQSASLEVDVALPSGIVSTPPIVDRKSKFVGHVARVRSVEDVRSVLHALRRVKAIRTAAHPTIHAYRFYDSASAALNHDCDDDGETGAARKISFLMEQAQLDGFIVVVTRWFGGVLLGPDRFKHIGSAAHDAIQLAYSHLGEPQPGAKSHR